MVDKPNGDIFRKGIPVEKLSVTCVEIGKNDYDVTPEHQKVFSDTTGTPIIKELTKDGKTNLRTFYEM